MAEVKETERRRRPGRPSEGAREALLEAALELFMDRDFAAVSTNEILERAEVSRGALYHHFDGKRQLYREVWMRSERSLIERLTAAPPEGASPFEALRAASLAYLDEAAENREMQRIGLLQSRTVLGWEGWREGIRDLGLAAMSGGVEAAMESGELRRGDPEATAQVLLGALIETGLLIATAKDQAAARAAAEPAFVSMLEGLRRS